MAQSLNSMTFPLHGARLIEASAGTGKTFTIAALYLRLLLGHGSDPIDGLEGSAHCQPLTVDQILVVTFTEAATMELRGRIRSRIHEARIAFRRGQSDDPIIGQLLLEFPDHQTAVPILLQAERQMDEAAIFTIHGFCQRMLTQNAFESGSRFQNELLTDESQLKLQVVSDYWRRNFYPMSASLTAKVSQLWSSPQALLHEISNYLSGEALSFPQVDLDADLEALQQKHLARIDNVKQLWRSAEVNFFDVISDSGVDKRSYSSRHLPNWIEQVSDWAQRHDVSGFVPDNVERFAQSIINSKTKKGEPASHAVFSAIDELIDNQPDFGLQFKYRAITQCRAMLLQAKQAHSWLSFDDLLSQLGSAIENDQQGLLTERIRQLFPVAMIDEFQDTDPLQYRIFSRIYLEHPQCGLFMIGDPKQAIYGFRGADIFTYIQARNEVADHYTLDTNWRSSQAVISGVNGIFEFDDRPFVYDDDIPFLPVNASPNAENMHWSLNDKPQAAFNVWLQKSVDGAPVSSDAYTAMMANSTAYKINEILSSAQQGNAILSDKKGQEHQIQASNIAVLVRTGREAKQVKQALSQQGIASVYLSNRDSVFDSVVAKDILRLLTAAINPSDARSLRSILASDLFALSLNELDNFNNDENAWENVVNEFERYQHVWLTRGVLPMIRAVLTQREIAERLLGRSDHDADLDHEGERKLTDLLHLAELIQQASLSLDGESALIRWLADNIEQHDGDAGDQIQRLESERNLVQIITIHKSKGLEYDLVFMPFVMNYRESKVAKYYRHEDQKTVLDLSKPEEGMELAEKERLAEDLRLLYVGLTRAVYGIFIGVTPLKKGNGKKSTAHLSAMGYLLQHHQQVDASELTQACEQLAKKVPAIHICEVLPERPDRAYIPAINELTDYKALQLQARIDRRWRMTSYSSLIKQSHLHVGDELPLRSDFDVFVDLEKPIDSDAAIDFSDQVASSDSASLASWELEEHDDPQALMEVDPWSMFAFPRGARPGTFLHTVFEQIEFTQAATGSENTAVIERLLQQEDYPSEWLPTLQVMVDNVLNTRLDGKDLCLSSKVPAQRLVEMEFLLPIETLSAAAVNRVTHKYDELSAQAPDLGGFSLNDRPLQGMLKGFIDLVFEHQGKYYVLDWKSNHLGEHYQDYQPNQLQQAMLEHRYDLQYQLYSLALHRFLRSRLANYDYETHFGGVYYLFLRGFSNPAELAQSNALPNGVFYTRPSFALLNELDNLIADTSPVMKKKLKISNDTQQQGELF